MCAPDEKKVQNNQIYRISPGSELMKHPKSMLSILFTATFVSLTIGIPFWLSMVPFSLGLVIIILYFLDYLTYLMIDRIDPLRRIFRKNRTLQADAFSPDQIEFESDNFIDEHQGLH